MYKGKYLDNNIKKSNRLYKYILLAFILVILVGIPDINANTNTNTNDIIYNDFDPNIDYSSIMMQSILDGTHDVGVEAEILRNNKIDATGVSNIKISYNDLLMLSKIIWCEAGSSWLPIEWKMDVGEVVLNRVQSSEFPNTLYDVIHQSNQYSPVSNGTFNSAKPDIIAVQCALRLLSGERNLVPKVVFQAEFRQGSGVYKKHTDNILGTTYLCISSYPEIYE